MKESQVKLPEIYEAESTSEKETGLRLFGIKHKETKTTIWLAEFNKDFDVHSTVAWAGARTSRSDASYKNIFKEIFDAFKESKYSAGEKLANVFVNYGHASVADMAPLMLYLNEIPSYLAFWIFNHTSVGAGQELSTRYVKIGNFGIEDPQTKNKELKKSWKEVQTFQSEMYTKWYSKIYSATENYLKVNNAKFAKSTIEARVLDVVRMWLPSGMKTSMTLMTSVRNWIDLVIQLRESNDYEANEIAEQIFTVLNLQKFDGFEDLKADLGGLTKYSEGKFTVSKALEKIQKHTREHFKTKNSKIEFERNNATIINFSDEGDFGEAIICQYISVLFPNYSLQEIQKEYSKLKDKEKKKISDLIFAEHHHHNLMRNAGDVRGILFELKTTIAYARDLNRHRAMGRLIPILESKDFEGILNLGINKNYQIENAEYLKSFQDEWESDFKILYKKLKKTLDLVKRENLNQRVLINLLPLGHQIRMQISGPITQFNYMNSLRIALGGDFGYRDLVYKILEELRSKPLLKSMLPKLNKPDVNNIEQICGRS